jgi:hypothetical protein
MSTGIENVRPHTTRAALSLLARPQAIPGFKTDLEERREAKLLYLRRRGKGPPKKGSGARSKKK